MIFEDKLEKNIIKSRWIKQINFLMIVMAEVYNEGVQVLASPRVSVFILLMVILLCPYIVFCVFPWFWIHLVLGHWLHWVEILYLWSVLGSCLLTDIITDFSNFGKTTKFKFKATVPRKKTLNDHFIKYMQLFLYNNTNNIVQHSKAIVVHINAMYFFLGKFGIQ